jgi:DNA repair exonuclease SbcCD ATPase subunit
MLISGPSGIGKSTILMAINYALYGGSIDISYGETKCRVEFEFKGLKIVRSKPPNRLIVNDMYEDAVAQQMIYDVYGKNFDVTGYIPQNTMKSFLKQGPQQKREFLESVQFENLHLAEKKEKLDTIIKTNKQELDKTIGKLEMAKSMLPEKPPEEVVFPLKSNDYEMTSKNQRTRLKNIETKHLVVKRKDIKNKESQLSALRVVNAQISGKDETIHQICSQMADLSITLESDSMDFIGEDRLAQYQKQLQRIKNNTQLQRLIYQRDADQEKMENMKTIEMAELSQIIASIETQLWVDYSKEETLELIESNKELLVDIMKIVSLKNKKVTVMKDDLPTLEKRKDTLTQSIEDVKMQLQSIDVLSCPSCHVNVLLEKGKLVPSLLSPPSSASAGDLRKQLQVLTTQLKQVEYDIIKFGDVTAKNEALDVEIESIVSQYEDELSDESEVKELVAQMESYYNTQMVLEKKLHDAKRKLKMELFSPSYQSCKQALEKLRLQIESLEGDDGEGDEEEEDEETIREMITTHQQKFQRIRQNKKQLSLQEETKKKLILQKEQHHLEFVSKYDNDDEEALVASIKVLKEEVKELEKNATEHRQNIATIDLYWEYKKNEAVYNTHLETIRTLEKQHEVNSDKYTLSKILKNDFMDVEHIALTNTVNDINAHANVLLQEFFDDTIFVNLSCFKEDKKKNEKPQINIDIKYRDKNCSLGSLSGGEYARVNLAFTLSLALIFKTPLLLLDETLSSLDEDASDVVFASIKKHFKNIPVITILHQVTSEGDFDQVIKL